MSHVFPAPDEVAGLVIQPGSITWRRGGDPRMFLVAGYALTLQVAHPTVGSGVRDHSTFEQAPWKRLLATLDYVNLTVYGGEDAAAVGRRLREYHQAIKGINPDGSRYHALEPEAYAWVHATLVDGLVSAHQHFGRPMRPDQIERLYREWLGIGRLIGVRPGQLPPDWTGFRAYFDEMVETRLVHNETVDRVLRSLRYPKAPLDALPDSLWAAATFPAAHVVLLATVGLLPPVLRERFGLTWSPTQDRELRALGAASRSLTPLIPRRFRVIGPDYLRFRRRQIARGPLSQTA
jgi:uncharacterized protein (DUF2236 family)